MRINKENAGTVVQMLALLLRVELHSEEDNCQGQLQGDLVEIFEEFFRKIEAFFKESPSLSCYGDNSDAFDTVHTIKMYGGKNTICFVYGYRTSFTRMDIYSGEKRKICVIVDKEKIFISD